jgi:hypothetical protein
VIKDILEALMRAIDQVCKMEVEGETEDNWFQVDLNVGNLGVDLNGWMEGIHVNFNGMCFDLPIVVP